MQVRKKVLVMKTREVMHKRDKYIYLSILVQSHYDEQFGKNGSGRFTASNGIRLISVGENTYDISWADMTLYLGKGEVEVSPYDLKDIAEAVREYNKTFTVTIPSTKGIIL